MEFDAVQQQLTQAARRDGLDEDGPMTPTLRALHLCMASLREMTRIISQIPGHYVGQILDAISASRTVAETETARFRAEIEHTEAEIVHRIAAAIAASADKALARRVRVFDRTTALVAALTLILTAGGCLGGGYWWGSSDAQAHIQQTEWRLQAAFARGGLAADLWAMLMESNDIAAAVKSCRGPSLIDTGASRTACLVPLWTEPAAGAPPRAQPHPAASLPATSTPLAGAPSAPASTAPKPINPLGILPTPPRGMVHFGPDG